MPARPQTHQAEISELLHELLRRSHLSTPSDLAQAVAEVAAGIGASEVTLYLLDYEQAVLVPVPELDGSEGAPVPVTGTIGGRAFSSTTILTADGTRPGSRRVWLPLLDGTERVGMMCDVLRGARLLRRVADRPGAVRTPCRHAHRDQERVRRRVRVGAQAQADDARIGAGMGARSAARVRDERCRRGGHARAGVRQRRRRVRLRGERARAAPRHLRRDGPRPAGGRCRRVRRLGLSPQPACGSRAPGDARGDGSGRRRAVSRPSLRHCPHRTARPRQRTA